MRRVSFNEVSTFLGELDFDGGFACLVGGSCGAEVDVSCFLEAPELMGEIVGVYAYR